MKRRITAIAFIIILLLSVTACEEQKPGNVSFGDYELPTEIDTSAEYDPANKIDADYSWVNGYIVSYSYFTKQKGESILYEGKYGNHLQVMDKASGIITYLVQEDAYMLQYLLDSKTQTGTVAVLTDESINSIAYFPQLAVCKENFPSYKNVTKVGTNFVGNRSATRYKQVEEENGVTTKIAYVWIDDELGFASKCELYDALTQDLLMRWEMFDFTTNVTEDAVKINLDTFDIVSE